MHIKAHNWFLMLLLLKTNGQTGQNWSLAKEIRHISAGTPQYGNIVCCFTTSTRVWHGAHHCKSSKNISRDQIKSVSEATTRRNPVQVFVKTVGFALFKRRAFSKLSRAPKVYVRCMKKDVRARKMRSTDGWIILRKCNLMKTRRVFPLLRVLLRARLVLSPEKDGRK